MSLSGATFKVMHELCNSFAHTKATEFTTRLEKVVVTDDKVIWDRDTCRKIIGEITAISYAAGYKDACEKTKLKKLFV